MFVYVIQQTVYDISSDTKIHAIMLIIFFILSSPLLKDYESPILLLDTPNNKEK